MHIINIGLGLCNMYAAVNAVLYGIAYRIALKKRKEKKTLSSHQRTNYWTNTLLKIELIND